MKKLLIFAAIFIFNVPVYAEKYTYKASAVNEIDIVISVGTLNIASGKTRNIMVDITPDKPESLSRHIEIGSDGNLTMYFDDETITEKTVVNITLPSPKNNIEINSADAVVNISNIKGSLNISAMNGKISVKNFFGNLEVNTANAKVNAEGGFKTLNIQSSDADILVSLRKIPSLYEYSITGAGNITFKIPSDFAKARLKINKNEFYGTLNIQ
ncbi:MAG: DUF4097 domain-containing protein [Endomicrobia bacterium]|nr:DUF4097 domain-containing protein [Bacillota bacterium]MCL1971889.1 DUF4097 domain-containing protein [Endomicrobiia bacterium]